MYKLLVFVSVLLLCLELTACNPATKNPSSIEPPLKYPNSIEPPLIIDGGNSPAIIAETLEITSESAVMWNTEYTKVDCRLVYGFKPQVHRYQDRVSKEGEFELYLTADALQQLGQAEMLLLYRPRPSKSPQEGYAASFVFPIVDGLLVLEGEWRNDPYAYYLDVINDHIQRIVDKRFNGEELSETEQLAPMSPLESGMTVEEVIAFFDTWGTYLDQVDEDFWAFKAQMESGATLG